MAFQRFIEHGRHMASGIPSPYLTEAWPGVGGRIKDELADFIVEEVPLYPPSGEGEHVYFEIEKTDLSTLEALERIGRALRRPSREFGFAGLKDRRGVTRQVLTIDRLDPADVLAIDAPGVRVLSASRHRNKLRVGHLRGNRFRIRVRDVEPDAERIEAVLAILLERGMPNWFGPQRFGVRGEAQWIGRAIVSGEDREAVERLLGRPSVEERNTELVAARWLFQQFRWSEALERVPRAYREERRILEHLLRRGEDWSGALRRLGPRMTRLYLAAFQSFLFNRVVERRLAFEGGDLGRFRAGDLAYLHRNGAVFLVDDPDSLVERSRAFEISPSGPLFGPRMMPPSGVVAELETSVLEEAHLSPKVFERLGRYSDLGGERRPLRVPVSELEWRLEGQDLVLSFFLPKGSYATSLLRELMKNDEIPEGFEQQ
ncbi:MAG TPA: tRNA pseudouridine(13) synthase TruD [Planctomycetota bacterium]|nr:tRNA pseudouridine(13) synthase TruD [Planctomycetota bacterium]